MRGAPARISPRASAAMASAASAATALPCGSPAAAASITIGAKPPKSRDSAVRAQSAMRGTSRSKRASRASSSGEVSTSPSGASTARRSASRPITAPEPPSPMTEPQPPSAMRRSPHERQRGGTRPGDDDAPVSPGMRAEAGGVGIVVDRDAAERQAGLLDACGRSPGRDAGEAEPGTSAAQRGGGQAGLNRRSLGRGRMQAIAPAKSW